MILLVFFLLSVVALLAGLRAVREPEDPPARFSAELLLAVLVASLALAVAYGGALMAELVEDRLVGSEGR